MRLSTFSRAYIYLGVCFKMKAVKREIKIKFIVYFYPSLECYSMVELNILWFAC